jgi:hypothetical protein
MIAMAGPPQGGRFLLAARGVAILRYTTISCRFWQNEAKMINVFKVRPVCCGSTWMTRAFSLAEMFCRDFGSRPSLSWSSIAKPRRRSASKYLTSCCAGLTVTLCAPYAQKESLRVFEKHGELILEQLINQRGCLNTPPWRLARLWPPAACGLNRRGPGRFRNGRRIRKPPTW